MLRFLGVDSTFDILVQTLHRSQLQKLLMQRLRSADKIIHFSKRLESYVEPASVTEPIVLRFKDGTEASCDLLVDRKSVV